jgi:hypothetical protein
MADLSSLDDEHDYAGAHAVDLRATRVLELCDPRLHPTATEDSMVDFWTQVQLTLGDEVSLHKRNL